VIDAYLGSLKFLLLLILILFLILFLFFRLASFPPCILLSITKNWTFTKSHFNLLPGQFR
jgi:hypothetical protein